MHNTHPILASLYHSMSPFKYTNSVTCSVLLRLGDDPEVPIAARQTRKTPRARKRIQDFQYINMMFPVLFSYYLYCFILFNWTH